MRDLLMGKVKMSELARKIINDPKKSKELTAAMDEYDKGKEATIEVDGTIYKLVSACK